MIHLDGKVVLVTGASSGIGAALARLFSKAGARVVLTARRRDRLEKNAARCPGETLVVPADLLKEAHRTALVDQTMKRWDRIDILANNAGLGIYGDFMSTTEAQWRQLFEINLFSVVFLTQGVLPVMKKQNEGLIVNTASIGGLMAHSSHVTPYVASKHAVVGFSRGLAMDLKGTGIRVLAVCPHLTDTEFFSVSSGAAEMAPTVEKYKTFMDTPEDVARGIIEQLDSQRVVVFPTEKPARAFQKQRDL
jgi:short-subunit dehydrogenase